MSDPPRLPDPSRLSKAQICALKHVASSVRSRRDTAERTIRTILREAGCDPDVFHAAVRSLRENARLVVHFHPDRYGHREVTVAEGLLDEGLDEDRYRTQFETGLSSGGLSAYAGGDRDEWERRLFGGCYHFEGASDAERPKYGALDLTRYPDGPWPRFGSCYLVLRPSVLSRTSFTFLGTEQAHAQERIGLIDRLECVMAALLTEIASGTGTEIPWPPFVTPTLGIRGLNVPGLLTYLIEELPRAPGADSTRPAGRVLDTGIEAQVHGPIDLREDVGLLVADPAFEGTVTGEILAGIERRYSIPLEWHCGFRMSAQDVPSDFRGPAIPKIAQRIARDGWIDADVIGSAERSLYTAPDIWADWGGAAGSDRPSEATVACPGAIRHADSRIRNAQTSNLLSQRSVPACSASRGLRGAVACAGDRG